MKVNLPRYWKARLTATDEPALLVPGEGRKKETKLAIRVETLFRFRRPDLFTTVQLVGTQGREGVWVVAIAFRITGAHSSFSEGVVYLNPAQEENRSMLTALTLQERLPLLFFSVPLTTVIQREIPWSVDHRQNARMLLAQIDYTTTMENTANPQEEGNFAHARHEFAHQYSVATLLLNQERKDSVRSSPSRGVVLD